MSTDVAIYPPTTSPDDNFDFCNSFWGVDDDGVDVLRTRMHTASRTIEDLRNFWKERSIIEEEYAKRLAKLAKMPVGRDEIGELRNSIDTLRLETDKQAGVHSQLAQYIQADVESQVGVFAAKQQHNKKQCQVPIEKEFKVKKTREQHATKAREKYESECLRTNSYAAQSMLVQGRDLEKIQLKLERAQQNVQASGNDYAHFTRVLQETMQQWEQDWKAFCDVCQDLEEQRMEFMKENMWAYANAVSTVCVSDIETRDTMRIALEQLEPEKDMENFVRGYGTGNAIPERPVFVNYANTDAPPVPSTRVATRPSNFVRSTQKANRTAAFPQDNEPYDDMNHPGDPSYRAPADSPRLSRSATQGSTASPRVNGHVSPTRELQRRQSIAKRMSKHAPGSDHVDPIISGTQSVIGDRLWDVDPDKDPQQQQRPSESRTSPPVGEQDPLAKQMAELNTAAAASGTSRRNSIRRDGPPLSLESRKGTDSSTTSASSAPRDFRGSADAVVGSYPLARTPTSPNPPKVVLAAPPSTSNIPVEQVVTGYQRPFPGEPRSRTNSYIGPPPVVSQNADPGVPRPTSRAGYPGIGTQSLVPRPTSPAHGPNPTAVQPYHRSPPAPSAPPSNGTLRCGVSISRRPVTPTNPNPVGIALGPDGRVVHDVMAQPVQWGPTHHAQSGPPRAIQPPQVYQETRRAARSDYADIAPSEYDQAPPYSHGGYAPQHPHSHAPPPARAQAYGQPASYGGYDAVTRPAYHGHQQSQDVGRVAGAGAVQQQQRHGGHANGVYRYSGPGNGQSPSPAVPRGQMSPPTGTYTDDGRPILFYVSAMFDYAATTDEEFSFQAGDIIAVTDTPDDGWWSGALLDDRRRRAGQHIFPSNFVCLF